MSTDTENNTYSNYTDTIIIDELIPSIDEANTIIAHYMDRVPSLKTQTEEIAPNRIIQDFFGFSDSLFEEVLMVNAGIGYFSPRCKDYETDSDLPCRCKSRMFLWSIGQIRIRTNLDIEEPLVILPDDIRQLRDTGAFPNRTISDLHPAVFNTLAEGFIDYGEDYVEEEGFPAWFRLISANNQNLKDILLQFKMICCGSFKDLIKAGGYNQSRFCEHFFISRRTVGDWCTGTRECRIYVRLMFAELMGLFERRKE